MSAKARTISAKERTIPAKERTTIPDSRTRPTEKRIHVTITGIHEIVKSSNIKVYPNPVSNELIIEFEGNKEKLNFEILNAIGQIVFKEILIEKTIVQTANFTPGVYLIKLENSKTFEFKKIVKE